MNKRLKSALIVEDDTLNAMAMEQSLADLHFADVRICGSLKGAISFVTDFNPDVLLLDVNLSDHSDGWAIAELVRETMSPTPVMLFVTGNPDAIPPHVARLGTVLAKPVSTEMIKTALSLD